VLERLEERVALSTLIVNSAGDEGAPDLSGNHAPETTLTLRQALMLHDGLLRRDQLWPQQQALISDPASLGTNDTIQFQNPSGSQGVIQVTYQLPALQGLLTLKGPSGAWQEIDEQLGSGIVGYFDMFVLAWSAVVTMDNVSVGNAQGHNATDNPGGVLILSNCVLHADGTGISNAGYLEGTGCQLTGNSSSGLVNTGVAQLEQFTVSGNSAAVGAGIFNQGSLSLNDSLVENNTAKASGTQAEGGGLFNGAVATATLTKTVIQSNMCDRGGGIFNDGTLTLDGATLATNLSVTANFGTGGGAFNDVDGTMKVLDGTGVQFNSSGSGAGIANLGHLIVQNSSLDQNVAHYWGGAIFNAGNFEVTNSEFGFNQTTVWNGQDLTYGGGAVYNQGSTGVSATIKGTEFQGNTSAGHGGAVSNESGASLGLLGCTLLQNSSQSGGGAVFSDGPLSILDTDFDSNHCDHRGGALFNASDTATSNPVPLVIGGFSLFTNNNSGDQGGAIYSAGVLTLNAPTKFASNSSGSSGGAVYAEGRLLVQGVTFGSNTCAASGGAINYDGAGDYTGPFPRMDVREGCVFTNNQASNDGGAVCNNGTGTIDLATFTNNQATNSANLGSGGAIANAGNLDLTHCTVSSNHAYFEGGGVYNEAELGIDSCTIVGNGADRGAGVSNSAGNDNPLGNATLHATNSTFTGNSAFGLGEYSPAVGGAVFNNGVSIFLNDTIAYNAIDSAYGGGLETLVATANTAILENSLIALNTGKDAGGNVVPEDIFGPVSPVSNHNLIGVGDASSNVVNGDYGNMVDTASAPIDPQFAGPLANNGGPTQTIALLPNSRARFAGSTLPVATGFPAPPTVDQRGYTRPIPPDIGAYQYLDVKSVLPRSLLPGIRYIRSSQSFAITISFGSRVRVLGRPMLRLNDGGTASYQGGSGTSKLTFVYSPRSGQNTGALDYASVNALVLNAGKILNAATRKPVVVLLPPPGALGSLSAAEQIVVDTLIPTATLTASPSSNPKAPIQVTVSFSEPVIGLNAKSASVADGRIVSFNGSGMTYVYGVARVKRGPLTFSLPSGAARDLAGNRSRAAKLGLPLSS